MTARIPLKANFTGSDVTSLGEFSSTDSIAVAYGGTGGVTAAEARTNLGVVIGTDVLAPTGDGSGLTGIDALPTQTSQSGKILTTNGTAASWVTPTDTDTVYTHPANHAISVITGLQAALDAKQAADATIMVDADIGSTVEAYDAAKYPKPTLSGTSVTATNASYHIASAGGITITLPASPSAGNYVIVKDGTGAAATTTFTVARNGSNIASSATDLTFDKNFAQIVMTYVNSTIGWSI